jgi:hypothetical protein
VRSQHLLDFIGGELANGCPRRKIGHSAKGDRGLSESAMERSYSELQHKDDITALALAPTAWPADHVQGRLVPRRGWKCGNLEMAVSKISTYLLEMISNRCGGNARSPERPPFSHFRGYFRGHQRRPEEWTSRPSSHSLELDLWRSLYLVGPGLSLDIAPPQYPQKASRSGLVQNASEQW